MYELEVSGIAKEYKRKTNDIQKTFLELKEELDIDLFASGAVFILRKGKKEAQVIVPSRRMRLFKNNENTRLMVEQYLLDQLV